jgi:hypothetical protein
VLFNKHSDYVGQHALLSASKHHWINYTEQKLDAFVISNLAARRGTELHALASELIRLNVKLPKTTKTLNAYVNDSLGFRLQPEVILFYSANCFGTADAIGFRNNTLRIFDLKTGITPTSFNQLYVYAALFCLEYDMKPMQIDTELRIYQNDEVKVLPSSDGLADPDFITHVMSRIVYFDRRINEIRAEALG